MSRTLKLLLTLTLAITSSLTAYQPAHANSISFNINGAAGTTPQPISGVIGNRVSLPLQNDLTKSGYTFAGWSTVIDGASVPDPYPIPTNPVTLYAKWVPLSYIKVTYDRNDGYGTNPQPSYGSPGTPITLPPQGDLSKSGYAFSGWSPSAVGPGVNYPASTTYSIPSAPITLYAKWTANTQVISFERNGSNVSGTVPRPMIGVTNSFINVPYQGDLVRPGYTFTGWSTQSDGGLLYPVNALYEVPAYSTSLYARWVLNSNSITYVGNGNTTGTSYFTQTAVPDSIIALPTDYSYNLSKAGYRFEGWNTSPDGYGTTYPAGVYNYRVPYGVTTLYAKWVPLNGQSITYDANGATSGLVPSYTTAYAGTLVKLATNTGPNALAKNNYMFGGWNTRADGLGVNYSAGATIPVPYNGLRLYARWGATYESDRSITTRTSSSSIPTVLVVGIRVSANATTTLNSSRTTKTIELSTYNNVRLGFTLPNTTRLNSLSRFTVYGSGLAVNSRLNVYVLSTLVATASVDYSGSFNYEGVFPGNLANGTHSVQVTGTSWGSNNISASFPFSASAPSTTTKSTIYFGYDSSELTATAERTLRNLVNSKILGKNINSISVTGFSGVDYEDLAWDRADAVANELWTLGVQTTVATNGKITGYTGQKGRRAEITIRYNLQ